MLYAQIKSGVIENIIVLDDLQHEAVFSKDFDYFLRVDNLDPMPCIGWNYDGEKFIPVDVTYE